LYSSKFFIKIFLFEEIKEKHEQIKKMNSIILFLILISCACSCINVHINNNIISKELEELRHKVQNVHNFSGILHNLPNNLNDFFSCLHLSSNHGIWEPSFRKDSYKNMYDLIAFINIEKKHIYIDVPKSGSTTIKTQLKKHGYKQILRSSQLPKNFFMKDYFSFTFVRDPLLRFNSAFGTFSARGTKISMKYDEYIEKLTKNNLNYFKQR